MFYHADQAVLGWALLNRTGVEHLTKCESVNKKCACFILIFQTTETMRVKNVNKGFYSLFPTAETIENKIKLFDVLPRGSGRAGLGLAGLDWGKASGEMSKC